MMSEPYKILYTKQALKDKRTAYKAGFSSKIKSILETLKENPFADYPPYEKLLGDLTGAYSRRINHQHRIVYEVYQKEHIVKIISMWLHYE
ncbi:MAG: Plasmid encoded toxin Txe [Pelotomaculum sp. PtaU1.Bin035]|nr:MAG: Plasmid encoded toxin Txe [Pelotomaculum sp. PtaU1.Bin035]